MDERVCSPDRTWMLKQGYVQDPLHEWLGGMAQDAWEYTIAHKILQQFIKPPKTVLEIGVYGGWTLMGWLALGAEKAVALDVYKRPSAPLNGKVVFIEGDSHDLEIKKQVYNELPKGVDFLFIDGDHSLYGCEADYNMYRDLVNDGGAIGFHDIMSGDVRATWREMVRYFPTIQIQNKNPDGSAMGIGLVFKLPGVVFNKISVMD